MSAIDVTKKILFERLYLVPGMGAFGPWVNCPYAPTTPTVHSTTISRFHFREFIFPEWPLIFLVITIHQIIWPSPGTLGRAHVWSQKYPPSHICHTNTPFLRVRCQVNKTPKSHANTLYDALWHCHYAPKKIACGARLKQFWLWNSWRHSPSKAL